MKKSLPNYSNSILNVTNSFLHHYGVQTPYNGIKDLDIELQNNYNHIIYILLDGLGVNVIKKHLSAEDALRKYLKREITSVFPPTTVAATNAVLSGLPPIATGYVGWTQYFPNEDTDLVVFLNMDYYTNKEQPELLRDKYLSYKTIYEQINEVDPSISTNEFFPSFRKNGSKSFKEQVEKVLLLTHHQDKSFNYVYWTEPDLSQHLYGIYSPEVHKVVSNLNKDFETLINHITDDTLVVLIADHGLTNIEEIPLKQHPKLINMLKRQPSIEPRATSFFVKNDKHIAFKNYFEEQFGDSFDLYTKEELLQSKLLGVGKEHPVINSIIGDFFSVAKSNKMFIFHTSKNYIGHHAGLSEDEMIVPLILYKNSTSK